jgi:hypothetical protein
LVPNRMDPGWQMKALENSTLALLLLFGCGSEGSPPVAGSTIDGTVAGNTSARSAGGASADTVSTDAVTVASVGGTGPELTTDSTSGSRDTTSSNSTDTASASTETASGGTSGATSAVATSAGGGSTGRADTVNTVSVGGSGGSGGTATSSQSATTTGAGGEGGAPIEDCECDSGPCCDGCAYLPFGTVCAIHQPYYAFCYESSISIDYQYVFCSGESPDCDGHTHHTRNTFGSCPSGEMCVPDSALGAHCE